MFTLQRNKEIIINKRIVNNEHKYNNSEAKKTTTSAYILQTYKKQKQNKNQLATPTELVNIFNISTRRQVQFSANFSDEESL